MSIWKRSTKELPENDSTVSIYFYHTGYDVCKFDNEPDKEYNEAAGLPIETKSECFYSKKGWLSSDDLLWSYDLKASEDKYPIPASYLDDECFRSMNEDPLIKAKHDEKRLKPNRSEGE